MSVSCAAISALKICTLLIAFTLPQSLPKVRSGGKMAHGQDIDHRILRLKSPMKMPYDIREIVAQYGELCTLILTCTFAWFVSTGTVLCNLYYM